MLPCLCQDDKFGIPKAFESGCIHASALIVGDYTEDFSHWEAVRSLGQWMKEEGIPGISGVCLSSFLPGTACDGVFYTSLTVALI